MKFSESYKTQINLHAFLLLAQVVKNLPAMQETRLWSLGQEDPLGREWQPTPVFLPGEFHGQRSLVGYSPWDHKESDMTKWLTLLLLTCLFQFNFQTQLATLRGSRKTFFLVYEAFNAIMWFSLWKERTSDTSDNMAEPWTHHAKWNKLEIKDKYCIILFTQGT